MIAAGAPLGRDASAGGSPAATVGSSRFEPNAGSVDKWLLGGIEPASLPPRRITVAGDKGYDTRGFVETLRQLDATPHIVRKVRSAVDHRTTRHAGYAISQRVRKRVEEIFGWMKTVGGLRKLPHRGGARVNWQFLFVAAVYNI